MSPDVREALRRAAAEPSAELDVRTLVRTSLRRKRRRTGVAGGSIVVVVAALVMGGLALSEPSAEVAITPRDTPNVPEGWIEVKVPDAGLRLAMPREWTQLDTVAVPTSSPSPAGTAEEVLVVGNQELNRRGVIDACSGEVPSGPGVWLSLFELRGFETGSALMLPSGVGMTTSEIADRPLDFRTARGAEMSCPPAGGIGVSNSLRSHVFRDGGRLFLARMVGIGEYSNAQALALEVLNTLRVTPLPSESTNSNVNVTPSPIPVTAPVDTGSAGAPARDDAEIRAAFLGWIDAQPKDNVAQYVEDGAGIADALRQGMSQHGDDALSRYSGRVDSIQVIDATHADVRYSILFNGQPQYSMRPGKAIKFNGKWMVTRETVCELLAVGAVLCPPRA